MWRKVRLRDKCLEVRKELKRERLKEMTKFRSKIDLGCVSDVMKRQIETSFGTGDCS